MNDLHCYAVYNTDALKRYLADEKIEVVGLIFRDIDIGDKNREAIESECLGYFGWYHVNPNSMVMPDLYKAAEKHLIDGFYLDPWRDGYTLEYMTVAPIFEIAAFNRFAVMIETSEDTCDSILGTQPILIETLATLYPMVPIVIAHGGVYMPDEADHDYWMGKKLIEDGGQRMERLKPLELLMTNYDLAFRYPNIFIELSSLSHPYKAQSLFWQLNRDIYPDSRVEIMSKKLVMGSEFGGDKYKPLSRQLEVVGQSKISDKMIERLCNNQIPRRVEA